MTLDNASGQGEPSPRPAHVRSSFQFTLSASLNRAAPLFGPEGERCWAGERWNPDFLHPQPAKDVQGAIFTVQQGRHKSVWVTTLFDVSAGQMQYVSFIPEVLVSTVDVRLTALDPDNTRVHVTYTRTALSADANEEVRAMAEHDRNYGAHWQKAIQSCLERQPR